MKTMPPGNTLDKDTSGIKQIIFIVGMPRSGTKLFRSLLNRHNAIGIPNTETQFWPGFIKKYGLRPGFNETNIRKSMFSDFSKSSFARDAGMKINEKSFLSAELKSYNDLFTYLISPYIFNKRVKIIGDKTPSYVFSIEILLKTFNNAKVIHIVRDPRDCALSAKKTWGKNIYRVSYQWQLGIEHVRSLRKSNIINNNNYYELKYEDLLNDPKDSLSQVCYFLSINFMDKMTSIDEPSENYGDARGKKEIVKRNQAKYLKEISIKENRKMEEICFEGLKDMNYKISFARNKSNVLIQSYYYWYLKDIFSIIYFRLKTKGVKGIGYQWILFKERLSNRIIR